MLTYTQAAEKRARQSGLVDEAGAVREGAEEGWAVREGAEEGWAVREGAVGGGPVGRVSASRGEGEEAQGGGGAA